METEREEAVLSGNGRMSGNESMSLSVSAMTVFVFAVAVLAMMTWAARRCGREAEKGVATRSTSSVVSYGTNL